MEPVGQPLTRLISGKSKIPAAHESSRDFFFEQGKWVERRPRGPPDLCALGWFGPESIAVYCAGIIPA